MHNTNAADCHRMDAIQSALELMGARRVPPVVAGLAEAELAERKDWKPQDTVVGDRAVLDTAEQGTAVLDTAEQGTAVGEHFFEPGIDQASPPTHQCQHQRQS